MVSIFSKSVFPLLLLFLIVQLFLVHSRTLKPQKEYFKNFQNLQESIQEGQTVNGLSKIKQYLQNLGYYSSDVLEVNDDFDRQLTFSLQSYQKNYHLNVTGTIDPETIKTMMVPRCGIPDIVNHTTLFHNSLKLHTVSHYSFFSGAPRWPSYDLTYRIIDTKVVDQQAFSEIISKAFEKWSAVTKFKFKEADVGKRADISVSFEFGDHGDGHPFDGPLHVGSNFLAHAAAPTVGKLHFDGDDNWSTTYPSKYQIDLETVAVHELGHILGLSHSMDPTAVMYANVPFGKVKRNLTKDDIDGIQYLYK